MFAVPAVLPESNPDPVAIVATVVLSLVHVPPVDASVSGDVVPTQIAVVPVIPDGDRMTLTVVSAEHPELSA